MREGPNTAFGGLARLQGHAVASRVDFRGFVQPPEVARLLAASDVFALPSRYETWGAAATEALAAGLPVALSEAVGSAPDIVGAGGPGRVVPVGDAPALAAALSELLAVGGRGSEMAALAQRRSVEWGNDLNLRSFAQALRDVGLDVGQPADLPPELEAA